MEKIRVYSEIGYFTAPEGVCVVEIIPAEMEPKKPMTKKERRMEFWMGILEGALYLVGQLGLLLLRILSWLCFAVSALLAVKALTQM